MASPPNLDRVQAVKWESPAKGGTQTDDYPTGIDETEDALSGRGVYFQPAGGPADEEVAVWRDGDDLKLQDKSAGPAKLSELMAGGGLTEAQHEALDTLVHDVDESSYDEVIYGSGNLVSAYIVWETAAKLKKVREEQYTYVGSKVSQSVTTQYDGTGAVKMTMTEIYTYSGSRVTSVTRTKS